MVWDKTESNEWVLLVRLYVESSNYGVKELIKLSFIFLSFDFMNKPPL